MAFAQLGLLGQLAVVTTSHTRSQDPIRLHCDLAAGQSPKSHADSQMDHAPFW